MPSVPYPMLRPKRRRHRWARRSIAIPRTGMRMVAGGILAVALLTIAILAAGSDSDRDPRRAFAAAQAAFARGDYSGARDAGIATVTGYPTSPAAHMMLARAYLNLGDGLAAGAELDRAVDYGVAEARIHGARARALWLQGDVDDALVAAQAAPAADPLAARTRARILATQGGRDAAEAVLTALIAAPPRAGSALVDLGQMRLDAGDIGGAAWAAARAVRAAPRDPATLTLQGEVVRTRYGPVAALLWFRAALARDPRYPPALIDVAATLGDIGRHADMLAMARRAIAARPGSPQALYLMATLAARADRMPLAQSLLATAGPIDRRIAGALLVSGGVDYRATRYEQAVGTWRTLVAQQPMNLTARRLLAAALLRSGDAQAALDTLAPLLSRDDADTYALTLAGRAAERLGDRAGAGRLLDRAGMAARAAASIFSIDAPIGAFDRSAEAAPGEPGPAIALIRARIATGDIAGAIDLARALAARHPGDPAVQRALGDALMIAGSGDAAVAAYTRAADLSFDEPTLLRLVDTLGRTGHAREASATLALYLAQNPASVVALALRAHWLVANGEGEQAIEPLEALRAMIGNRHTALLTDLTLAYVAGGEATVARRYARAAYALAPLDPAVVDAYGLALAADRDIPAARQLFAKAMLLDPGNATIRAHAQAAAR